VEYDALTEQYYLRASYYNPILGRFMQEDVYQGDRITYGEEGNSTKLKIDILRNITKDDSIKDTTVGSHQAQHIISGSATKDPVIAISSYLTNSHRNGIFDKNFKETSNKEDFLRLLEVYGIEKNEDIVEYFCSYYFLGFSVTYKNYLIGTRDVEVLDGYKRLKWVIDAYTDQNGRITHIPIGIEQHSERTVVVEIKTGIVKTVNCDTGKMRKIAPSLEEFIKGWETVV